MKTTRLSIWIKGKPVHQGKFYYLNGKPTFLFNVDRNKWFKNFEGYTIAEQVLKAFKNAHIKPQIIAKNTDTHINYVANRSMFYDKGIFGFWGGHEQRCLPLKNWKVFRDKLEEPFELPVMSVDEWMRAEVDMDEYQESRIKLSEIWKQKQAELAF